MVFKVNDYLRRAISKRFGRSVPHPDIDAVSRFRQTHDPKENTDTTPPDDEFIDLYCLWAVEFYTPDHMDSLVNGFRKLGWEAEDTPDSSNRDPVAWLYRLRHHYHGEGWMNLGFLIPKDSDLHFLGGLTHRVTLPASVRYASGRIYAISPSLIGIVICFVFEEGASAMFDKVLRTDRQTYTTPTLHGHKIHFPMTQKIEHISQIRVEMSKLAATWFSENLPGLFSSGLLNGELPTCELVTLRKAEPFQSRAEGDGIPPMYLRILGLLQDFDAWRSTKIPGLKFRVPREGERSHRYHSILAVKESAFVDAIPDGYGSKGRSAGIGHMDMIMPDLLVVWAILPLLAGYTQHMRKVRDSAILRPGKRQNSIDLLETLGGHVSYSVDIASVASELAAITRDRFPLVHLTEPFEPCHGGSYQKGPLQKNLLFAIGERASWLQKTDKAIRDHLTQYGSLLGATENVRVQKKISNLTWILIFFGIATLLTPWIQDILSYFKKLWT